MEAACLSLPERAKINKRTAIKQTGPGCPQGSNFDVTRRILGSHIATRDINFRFQRVEDSPRVNSVVNLNLYGLRTLFGCRPRPSLASLVQAGGFRGAM